jgi:hypothetical protein
MKKSRLFALAFLLSFAVATGIAACGGGALESCPSDGVICSSCAAGGDCNITCDEGETGFCGHFGFFDDPNTRCTFCDSREDPFSSASLPLEP